MYRLQSKSKDVFRKCVQSRCRLYIHMSLYLCTYVHHYTYMYIYICMYSHTHIDNGDDYDWQRGMTALLLACAAGDESVVSMLVPATLAAGAADAQNEKGHSVLMCAAEKGWVSVVELLVADHGSSQSAKPQLTDQVCVRIILCQCGYTCICYMQHTSYVYTLYVSYIHVKSARREFWWLYHTNILYCVFLRL